MIRPHTVRLSVLARKQAERAARQAGVSVPAWVEAAIREYARIETRPELPLGDHRQHVLPLEGT